MGPLRIMIHSPPRTPDTMATSDIVVHNDEYTKEVLGLEAGLTEDAIDAELVAKANTLGITTSTLQKRTASSAFSSSSSTPGSTLDQTFSAARSCFMPATPPSSDFATSSTDLVCGDAAGFTLYDQFIAGTVSTPALEQVRFRNGSLPVIDSSARSMLSVNTHKSFSSVKSGFKPRSWWKKKTDPTLTCHGCRVSAGKMVALHGLSCNHTYCSSCVRYVVSQACSDEARMPPRCCAQPLPSRLLQDALDRDTQQRLFKAVAHFSTAKRSRIYCPDDACGEFINPRQVTDHKYPHDVTCQRCLVRACRTCKSIAHPVGVDCPDDWELEAVKRMGRGATRWRRCHGCRSLLSLAASQGREARMVCRCKEELCALCGGIWDPTTGCPNLCGDEAELEQRRSGLPTPALSSSGEAATRTDADRRLQRSPAVQDLVARQTIELSRFCSFAARTRSSVQARHASDRLTLLERHIDAEDALTARHATSTSALEDRQIAAEMELRSTLEQTARSVNLRLKHMEAYCQPRDAPERVVTEGNLRELGQQYALRDGMERQHQAKVNVMRERQARRMAELLEKQEQEAEVLTERQRGEARELDGRCREERREVEDALRTRQVRLDARWRLQADVLRRECEAAEGVKYGEVTTPEWPREQLDGEQERLE